MINSGEDIMMALSEPVLHHISCFSRTETNEMNQTIHEFLLKPIEEFFFFRKTEVKFRYDFIIPLKYSFLVIAFHFFNIQS